MGTRSRIGILEPDGSVTSIYCHWDGYPSHHGPILLNHYATEEKVRALMALGDISVLGEELGEKHDFDEPPDGVCNVYGRDRGEEGVSARRSASVADFKTIAEEYMYLFQPGIGWQVSERGDGYTNLIDLIKNNTQNNSAQKDMTITMTTQNIFEYATRNKLRFTTARGELSVEQLWDVPLRGAGAGFDLNTIAKTTSKALKEISEENFVETTKTTQYTRLEVALEVVKHVISVKLADEEVAKKRAANRLEKEQLLRILSEKQAGQLSELSVEDLQKKIAALGE